jgi:hypothetical protein
MVSAFSLAILATMLPSLLAITGFVLLLIQNPAGWWLIGAGIGAYIVELIILYSKSGLGRRQK